jgi:glycosyltransferase involved in cell wall biosynthesis
VRILFVDLEREWRGGQSQAVLLLEGLLEKGHDVDLVSARGTPITQRAAKAGVLVHPVPRAGLRLWAARAIRGLMGSGDWDVLHVNEPHALTAAWIAGAQKSAPILISRRIGFPIQQNRISQARYAAVRRFIANCEAVAQSLVDCGIKRERIAIVNEGVEVPPIPPAEVRRSARKSWGVEEGEFLFGCVGFLLPEKGQKFLIEALAQIRAEFPRTRLLLAGDGPCRAELEQLAKNLGVSEAVTFAGFVEDVDRMYAALDTFLFPSLFEGMGTSLQAAMAWGLPAISTARGGLAEVVDDGETSLVVEPDGKQFAAAMRRLLREPGLRERLGRAARREVEIRFSADRMVNNTLRVYKEVSAQTKRAPRNAAKG